MKNYFKMLNESFDKLFEQNGDDIDDFEILDDVDIDLHDLDISTQISPVIQDDTWEVFIPRSTDMLLSLGFDERVKYQKGSIIYVFKNKKNKDLTYILNVRGKRFGKIELTDSSSQLYNFGEYDYGREKFVSFILEQTGEKIQDWAIKKFPTTFGKTIKLKRDATRIASSFNNVFIYPKNKKQLEDACSYVERWGQPSRDYQLEREVKQKITKGIAEEGTEVLGSDAFSGMEKMTEVTLPGSLKEIGKSAFYTCRKLASIELPEGLKKIGERAFSYSGLQQISFPDSLESLGPHCFESASNLTKITLPKNIEEIPRQAFWASFKKIAPENSKIIIPEKVHTIQDEAFGYCKNVQFYIPKTVQKIGSYAFYQAQNVDVYCEAETPPPGWNQNNFKGYSEGSTFQTSFATFHWGAYVPEKPINESLGDGFEVLDDEVEISVVDFGKLEDNATKVCSDDYWEVWKPTSQKGMLNLAQGTKWLGGSYWGRSERGVDAIDESSWAFRRWDTAYVIINKQKPAKRFLFQDGGSEVFSPSFASYSAASWITKQKSSVMINWFADQGFAYVSNRLKKVVTANLIDEHNGLYVYPDFGNAENAREKITRVVITPGTRRIKNFGLNYLRNVTEVEVPDSVKTIGSSAFDGCESLKSIKFSSELTKIESYAFSGCRSLKTIIIPPKVKAIYSYAFRECDNLTTVYIPKSVERMGVTVFGSESFGKQTQGKDLTIYCEAPEKPVGWDDDWLTSKRFNFSMRRWETVEFRNNIKVVWGATMPTQ